MRKMIIGVIVVLLVVTGVYFVLQSRKESTASTQNAAELDSTFVITSRGNDYLEMWWKGAKVGDEIGQLSLLDYNGEEVSAIGSKKTLFVYEASNHHNFYPLLEDWARTYVGLLEIIVVLKEAVNDDLAKRLIDSGVHAVVGYEEIVNLIDPGYMNYNFLIDEHGKIIHRFKFEPHLWREMSKNVDLFARKSVLPVEVEETPLLTIGNPLSMTVLLDESSSWFKLSDFKGKPTILFLLAPGERAGRMIVPLIQNLHNQYEDEINLLVICAVHSLQHRQLMNEYFDRYNLTMGTELKSTNSTFVQWLEENLTGVKVYFDQNHRIFTQSQIWMTPTVLLIGKDLKLVDIFGVGLDGGVFLNSIQKDIDQQLAKLF